MNDTTRNAKTADEQLPPVPAMEDGEGPTDAELKSVADKSREIVRLENHNALLQKQIDDNLARIRELENVELPAAMKLVGLDAAPLGAGYVARREDFVAGSILAENRVPAYQYMRREGAGDLIKQSLELAFPMGCEALAKKAIEALKKVKPVKVRVKKGKKWLDAKLNVEQAIGCVLELGETIHHSSLQKWVRDRREVGKEIDPAYVQVHEGSRAWVERPKVEKPTETGM